MRPKARVPRYTVVDIHIPVEVVEEGDHVKAKLEAGLDGVVFQVIPTEHVGGVIDALLPHTRPFEPPALITKGARMRRTGVCALLSKMAFLCVETRRQMKRGKM